MVRLVSGAIAAQAAATAVAPGAHLNIPPPMQNQQAPVSDAGLAEAAFRVLSTSLLPGQGALQGQGADFNATREALLSLTPNAFRHLCVIHWQETGQAFMVRLAQTQFGSPMTNLYDEETNTNTNQNQNVFLQRICDRLLAARKPD